MTARVDRRRRGGERAERAIGDFFAPGAARGGPGRLEWRGRTTESTAGGAVGRQASGRIGEAEVALAAANVLKQVGARAMAVLLMINFLGYATIGPNGIFRLTGYPALKGARSEELARLGAEQAILRHHLELLDPNSADPDFVDEMLRTQLGLVRPDEVIIMTPDAVPANR
jgi:cell division protein FtsB